MTTETTQAKPAITGHALLKELQKEVAVFRDCLPLAIGIDKQLIAARPDVSRRALRHALALHTRSVRYLKAMQNGTVRFNLDGSEADAVTAEQREHAATSLKEHFKKAATARREKEAADAAAEAERQRSEKLQQLAAKFAKH